MLFLELLNGKLPTSQDLFASLSFGRSTAQYYQLIEFLAVVSIAIWAFVLASTFIRMGARFIWYKRKQYKIINNEKSS